MNIYIYIGDFIFSFAEDLCELLCILLLGFLFKTEEAVKSVAIPVKKTKLADLILGCFSLTTVLTIAYNNWLQKLMTLCLVKEIKFPFTLELLANKASLHLSSVTEVLLFVTLMTEDGEFQHKGQ
jgi:hypothetical protein